MNENLNKNLKPVVIRVPQTMADDLKKYAAHRNRSMTAQIRGVLEVLLEQDRKTNPDVYR